MAEILGFVRRGKNYPSLFVLFLTFSWPLDLLGRLGCVDVRRRLSISLARRWSRKYPRVWPIVHLPRVRSSSAKLVRKLLMVLATWAVSVDLRGPLEILPPVEFCCVYGSSLLSNNNDRTSMVDYILGVLDPVHWHSENLERNRHHYSKLMAAFGPKAVTRVADRVGVGVHFNPFVEWRDKMIKYGVVGMQELAWDVLTWDRFYLSGRLQKPVHVLVDNWDIRKVNLLNLKSAISSALLLLPPEFSEEDLYAKICSLSYVGDLRMLFAEDKNKVKKIVRGSFQLFRSMYKPLLQEYAAEGLLNSQFNGHQESFKQDCSLSASSSLFSSLPCTIQRRMAPYVGLTHESVDTGGGAHRFMISSREEAANCIHKALRQKVMVASLRQASAGVLAAGGVNAARYLARKMSKAWRSRR